MNLAIGIHIITHFNGTTCENGGYDITGDTILEDGEELAFLVRFNNICDCEELQQEIKYPYSAVTSGNSVYKSAVIGVYETEEVPTVSGYIKI